MSTPWEKLPKKVQDAILCGTGEEEVEFVYEDGVRRYTNTKPFEGVIGNIERRFRETESDWVREELSRYQDAHPCDACGGYRLKPQALAVKVGRQAHRRGGRSLDPRRQPVVRRAARHLQQEADRDRHPHPQGDPRAAAVPGRRRPRLSHAVARGRHAVGRREPAHPAGLADRLRPHRRALRAGRALHRPAPARQRPPAGDAQAPARHRQHRDRGRARRGRDPLRRPRGRHRPRRRHPRRPRRRPGHARRDHGQRREHHRPVPHRRAPDPHAEGAAQARQGQAADRGRRAREQPQGRHGRDPARAAHLHHRRVRRRQVHAADRHALQGGGAPAQRRPRASGRARPHRGPGAPRQGDRHRPVADRPHAALQPGHLHGRLHAHPRVVLGAARGQGARLPAGALLLQRQGRALRGLPGRRRHQDRDALPARRLRHLRPVQGQALQPRDAGGAASRTSRSPTCST